MIKDFTEQEIKDIDEYLAYLKGKHLLTDMAISDIRDEAFEENNDFVEIMTYICEELEEEE